jgi:CRP-like cAMP-binding protein
MHDIMQEHAVLIQFFQHSGLVSGTSAMEMAAVFQPFSLAKDGILLREGQVSDTYLFLDSGWIRAFALTPQGNEATTALFSDRQVVLDVASFFQRIPARETLHALTDCKGWAISFTELNNLFHSRPEFREFGRLVLVKAYAALKSRMLSMITETAEQRYAAMMKHNPEIFQFVPLKYIASYLGVTDTSLSRIRRKRN